MQKIALQDHLKQTSLLPNAFRAYKQQRTLYPSYQSTFRCCPTYMQLSIIQIKSLHPKSSITTKQSSVHLLTLYKENTLNTYKRENTDPS
ncbi:MAG: hypothetical protein PV344_01235, partial [Anaplasma sp.]|nr:hypothetical protein [Anaplasma sp.]